MRDRVPKSKNRYVATSPYGTSTTFELFVVTQWEMKNMNEKTVRLAIIGTGQRGTSFVKSIHNSENVRLTALCDIDEKRLKHFANGNEYSDVVPDNVGHGGGDQPFFDEFARSVTDGTPPAADLYAGLSSTIVANAIDDALISKTVVEINEQLYDSLN
jgi:hypothetical protein